MTICAQLLDESPHRGLVLRCTRELGVVDGEPGHLGDHQSRGWRSSKRRGKPAKRRVVLNAEETRDRLKTLMRGDE